MRTKANSRMGNREGTAGLRTGARVREGAVEQIPHGHGNYHRGWRFLREFEKANSTDVANVFTWMALLLRAHSRMTKARAANDLRGWRFLRAHSRTVQHDMAKLQMCTAMFTRATQEWPTAWAWKLTLGNETEGILKLDPCLGQAHRPRRRRSTKAESRRARPVIVKQVLASCPRRGGRRRREEDRDRPRPRRPSFENSTSSVLPSARRRKGSTH